MVVRADGFKAEFMADVLRGLAGPGQKQLPPKYFYDDLGSALFEAITLLEEYGLARADERLLERHALEIAARCPAPVRVLELGGGSGRKTRHVLEALVRRQSLTYVAVDVSAGALERCERELAEVAGVRVASLQAAYLDGLRHAAANRAPYERLVVLFLGSNIGNFDRAAAGAFLGDVRRFLIEGDAMLLGADLVKPPERLLPAYDDPAGVTAAFNLNVLRRINRELGADFDLRAFAHQVRYDEAERRIEMHLRSKRRQRVWIAAARREIRLQEGETIWTESSHKFTLADLGGLAARAGFRVEANWVDLEWPFVECLWVAE